MKEKSSKFFLLLPPPPPPPLQSPPPSPPQPPPPTQRGGSTQEEKNEKRKEGARRERGRGEEERTGNVREAMNRRRGRRSEQHGRKREAGREARKPLGENVINKPERKRGMGRDRSREAKRKWDEVDAEENEELTKENVNRDEGKCDEIEPEENEVMLTENGDRHEGKWEKMKRRRRERGGWEDELRNNDTKENGERERVNNKRTSTGDKAKEQKENSRQRRKIIIRKTKESARNEINKETRKQREGGGGGGRKERWKEDLKTKEDRVRREGEARRGGAGGIARHSGGVAGANLPTNMLLVVLVVVMVGVQEVTPQRYDPQNLQDSSITLGIMYPKTMFRKREYEKAIQDAVTSVRKLDLNFMKNFALVNSTISMGINPSPTSILNSLCEKFLPENVSAIIFLSCTESYGRATASAQYFLQLAGYLGIPVIAWNADNSGLEQAAQTGLRIQLAPSVHHQANAMLSILVRYQWHSLSIVTSQIAGHTDFVQAVRDQVAKYKENYSVKFMIIDTIVIDDMRTSLLRLKNSEARIVLLYSTKEEAVGIMDQAKKLGLVDKDYMWIVTQSVVGDKITKELPVGMLGVHFDTSMDSLTPSIQTAVEVFAYAIEEFVNQTRFRNGDLNPRLSCNDHRNSKWGLGSTFYRHLRDVSIPKDSTTLSFNTDGTRQDVELKIVNLRDSTTNTKIWEEIGVWRSWEEEGLSVNDIVWPGNGHVPPQGVPEKFELKIVFLEEPPYISLAPADPVTHQCTSNSGVPCKVPPSPEEKASGNASATTRTMCCSGFCIDLLEKFATDLGFTYELVRVEDGKWGTMDKDHRWNGLIGELLRRDGEGAEMALTSLKINKERESVVDFTVPFLESGIAIVVAKRTGIISPTAFLEPFDTASWMLVAFVAIQVAALTIFLFEWLSPGGYNMRMAPPRDHKFSLFRTYWLVWAVLFQAAVHVDCPRGFTARFMANMWAMFAVVFLAIYTANLAAFMITREEFHDFSGLNDTRLQFPHTVSPAYKFGTVEETNSAMVLRRHQPHMYHYMVRHGYNRPFVQDGVKSIKKNELDAFFYDATVLDYLVGQDDDCQILTVGSWYSMSGYGLAFPRGSKYLTTFNNKLMTYKDNGEIERLQRFWMTGTCKPMKQQRRASEPLAIEQFLSAYLLLGIGMALAVVLLGLEHIYFKYVRKHLAKKDSGGCCALVSLSMGKSLTFRGAVYEATNKLRRHRCRDPLCDTHIWKVKHELDMARVTIRHLEKQLEANGHKPAHKKYLQQAHRVTSSQQHLLQQSQGPQGATPGEVIAPLQASYRRPNTAPLYMETVLSQDPTAGGLLGGQAETLPLPHPQQQQQQQQAAPPTTLLTQQSVPTTPRKRSFESRSPESPLAGLIRCQHQLK